MNCKTVMRAKRQLYALAEPQTFATLTYDQFGDVLLGVSTPVPVLHGLHHVEPDGLVAALLHDGGSETLVNAAHAWRGDQNSHKELGEES